MISVASLQSVQRRCETPGQDGNIAAHLASLCAADSGGRSNPLRRYSTRSMVKLQTQHPQSYIYNYWTP